MTLRHSPPYEFTLRVEVSPLQRIQSEDVAVTLPGLMEGKDVFMRSAQLDGATPRPFNRSTTLDFSAAGFASEEDARNAGLRFRDALVVAAGRSRVWLDVGADHTSERPVGSGIAEGVRSRLETHRTGLYVSYGPMQFGGGFGACIVAGGVLNAFVNELSCAVSARVDLTPKQRLALELYGLAHFQSSLRAEFVILISVVEILAERSDRPPASQALVDSFIAEVASTTSEEAEKQSLISALKYLKRESISKACRQLVRSKLGTSAEREFTEMYAVRSQLLHTGNAESVGAMSRMAHGLDIIVSNLIQSEFALPST